MGGKADLLSDRSGQPLQVAVRRELLGAAGVGSRLDVRARLTQNGPVAEGYPREGDFQVEQG